jgi:hypothetical protein
MTDNRDWSAMTPEEAAVVSTILSKSGVPQGHTLIDELNGAVVSRDPQWVIDVRPVNTGPGADLPDGPFPAHAFVPNQADYQGEIIVWIKNGHLDGLEYAWVTDEPPVRWPGPDEMEVVPD